MRGLDLLAQACAPQEPTETAAQQQALTDEQCEKIASKVLERLQGGQQKSEDPTPDPEEEQQPEPQEGEENAEE